MPVWRRTRNEFRQIRTLPYKPMKKLLLGERFWNKVQKGDGCWEWTACRNPSGYGMIIDDERRTRLSHRIAWQLTNGPIPQGVCVLHRCDNPPCCNPGHLFLGARLDNNVDRAAKGRGSKGMCIHTAKLTEENVMDIIHAFGSGARPSDVAREWGISHPTAKAIMRGTSWKHIQRAA